MEYLTIPTTAIAPSRICLGAGGFGSSVPKDDAWALLDAFAALGGNFVDSAHVYAAWIPGGGGVSERTVGSWLTDRGMRDGFIVGTKGGHPDLKTMHISRLSPVDITQDLTESLERLGTDYIDIYWLHRDDPSIPVGEILGVLNEHLAAGRIRALGASNWTSERLREAAAYAKSHDLVGFCASQIGWSLARANAAAAGYAGMLYMDEATQRYHEESSLPVVAYSSQAGGFFSGKYSRPSATREGEQRQGIARLYFTDANFTRLKRATELATRHNCTPNQIAVAFLLSHSYPVYAIVGAHTLEQVKDSCGAAELRLTMEEMAYLDAL